MPAVREKCITKRFCPLAVRESIEPADRGSIEQTGIPVETTVKEKDDGIRALTNDTLSKRGTLQSGQPQVTDLNRTCGPCDEDVIALQVAVNDGWGARMQEVQALQDLMTPSLKQL